MKRILLTASVLFLFSVTFLKAQQDPKFTHYMFNEVVYNPAFIGSNMDQFCANLVNHQQWMGMNIEDGSTAPTTTTFNVHRPFYLKNKSHKMGAGLVVYSDQLGFTNSTSLYGGLSYHYKMGESTDPAVGTKWLIGGLNVGFIQSGIDGSKLTYIDQGDPLIGWLVSDGNHMAFDFGLGLQYKTDKYYIGLSNMHINQSQIDWFDGNNAGGDNQYMRHFYLNAGYDYVLIEDFLVIKPRTLIKFDKAKLQVDLGALAEINGIYWGGLNVRGGEGMMLLAGAKVWEKQKGKNIHQLKLGVSYDITFSQLGGVSNGTLEFMANYCFPIVVKPKLPSPEHDVRFLGGMTL